MEKCYIPQIISTLTLNSLYVAKSNIPQSLTNLSMTDVTIYAPVKVAEAMEDLSVKADDDSMVIDGFTSETVDANSEATATSVCVDAKQAVVYGKIKNHNSKLEDEANLGNDAYDYDAEETINNFISQKSEDKRGNVKIVDLFVTVFFKGINRTKIRLRFWENDFSISSFLTTCFRLQYA